MAVKKSNNRSAFWIIHSWKKVHLQQLKGVQYSKQGMWKGYIFWQKWYIKAGKGLDLGAEPPRLTFCSFPPTLACPWALDLLSRVRETDYACRISCERRSHCSYGSCFVSICDSVHRVPQVIKQLPVKNGGLCFTANLVHHGYGFYWITTFRGLTWNYQQQQNPSFQTVDWRQEATVPYARIFSFPVRLMIYFLRSLVNSFNPLCYVSISWLSPWYNQSRLIQTVFLVPSPYNFAKFIPIRTGTSLTWHFPWPPQCSY